MAYTTPNASQVVTMTPGGGDVRWLGSIAHVTGLNWSFAMPGGPDQLTCTLQAPATLREPAINPGRTVSVIRGGHQVWAGKLDEPVPTASGWNLSAVGVGNQGSDFQAYYALTWPTGNPDEAVNRTLS